MATQSVPNSSGKEAIKNTVKKLHSKRAKQEPLTPSTFLPADDAFVRARECAAFLGIGLSTWWAWVKNGRVDRPIKLGPKTSVWQAGYVRDLQRAFCESEEENQDDTL